MEGWKVLSPQGRGGGGWQLLSGKSKLGRMRDSIHKPLLPPPVPGAPLSPPTFFLAIPSQGHLILLIEWVLNSSFAFTADLCQICFSSLMDCRGQGWRWIPSETRRRSIDSQSRDLEISAAEGSPNRVPTSSPLWANLTASAWSVRSSDLHLDGFGAGAF